MIRAADELVTAHPLSDPTWRDLATRYPTEQLIEICLLVGQYAMLAGTLTSLGVQIEDGYPIPDWAGERQLTGNHGIGPGDIIGAHGWRIGVPACGELLPRARHRTGLSQQELAVLTPAVPHTAATVTAPSRGRSSHAFQGTLRLISAKSRSCRVSHTARPPPRGRRPAQRGTPGPRPRGSGCGQDQPRRTRSRPTQASPAR